MKIAFLFFGQLRWFENTHQTFQQYVQPVLQGHQIQYFAHFWEDLFLQRLPDFKQLYSPLELITTPNVSEEEIWDKFNMRHRQGSNLLHQTYSFYQTQKLLENYQNKYQTQFDIYIKLRTDLVFLTPFNLDIDQDSLYTKDIVHWRPLSNYVNDYLAMTKNYNNIRKLGELGFGIDRVLDRPEELKYSSSIYCAEEILARHLVLEEVPTKTYTFNVDLARHHQQ